jgi:hypothetical protein
MQGGYYMFENEGSPTTTVGLFEQVSSHSPLIEHGPSLCQSDIIDAAKQRNIEALKGVLRGRP